MIQLVTCVVVRYLREGDLSRDATHDTCKAGCYLLIAAAYHDTCRAFSRLLQRRLLVHFHVNPLFRAL